MGGGLPFWKRTSAVRWSSHPVPVTYLLKSHILVSPQGKMEDEYTSHALNEALSKMNSPYIYIHIQCASLHIQKWQKINNSKAKGRVQRKRNSAKSISHLPSHHWGHLQCTVPLSIPLKGRTLRNRTEKDRGTVSAKNDSEFPYHNMFTTLKFQWIPHRHNIVYHKMMQWSTNKHSIHLILLC